eukprot:GHUV01047978.1.p1 GENE.GHUV01047978.1~~GHUV01047978.1.p1  ORF type:complete len:142 (+),score=28.89 GHUV01047978.1:64-489(+)
MACLRCGSGIVLGLCLASWVIALGGLGAMNWLVCSNYDKTVEDIVANYNTNYNTTTVTMDQIAEKLNIPQVAQDVALCARSWRWDWFCMIFRFTCVVAAGVITAMPSRLGRSRFPLANCFSIATVIIMVSIGSASTAPAWR